MTAATTRLRLSSTLEGLRDRLTGGFGASGGPGDVLYRARHGCYLVLGFSDEQAFRLAVAPDATVAKAARLVELGCSHETALAILA